MLPRPKLELFGVGNKHGGKQEAVVILSRCSGSRVADWHPLKVPFLPLVPRLHRFWLGCV